ncbi:MAG: MBL fold metallo-hydrolase [Deferribacteraceae bacterium]|jgi:glyoxylase-like metal-dependent hydrolase (beta-lactamase superfamily II)|nr:MBL fold metallo-hydrolase [Deferribacteraceae bacterium]
MRNILKLLAVIMIMAGAATMAYAQEIHRYKLGDFELIAIMQQANAMNPANVLNENPSKLASLTNIKGWDGSSMSYFVLKANGKTILFDTGLQPTNTKQMLAKAGVMTDDVDMIVLTHTHGDHIGGMVDGTSAVFKKAHVYIATEEAAWWEKQGSASAILKAYSNMTRFAQNANIAPGIVSVPAFGHTPGHTAYKITSGGKTLVIWGDIVHTAIQFMDPDTYLKYDSDPKTAIATRKALMADIAGSQAYVAGMHMVSPLVGKIKEAETGYEFVPQPDGAM